MTLTVQPARDAGSAVQAVRNVVRGIDPSVPVYEIRPMSEWLNDSIWRIRLSTVMLAIFAGVALALAAVGVYGVMAYSVLQRTREIGIRLALGSTRGGVLRLVLQQVSLLSAAGYSWAF